MSSKNINLAITAALVGTSGISYQMFSENQTLSNNWTSIANKQWWNKNVSPEYALSETQATELNQIRLWNNEKIVAIQIELSKLRNGFEGLDTINKSVRQKLREYKVEIWNLEDKIHNINKETEMQISKTLTDGQLTFFNKSGYGWWSKVDGTWSSDEEKLLAANQQMRMSDRGFSW